jgi:membrane fusion protein, multidrug efflux system
MAEQQSSTVPQHEDASTPSAQQAPAAAPPPPQAPGPKRIPAGRLLSGAIVLAAVLLLLVTIYQTNLNPRTDDAEVIANFIGIAPQVDGPIARLNVRDNQFVRGGAVLFQIDPRPYEYALERAQSDQRALEGQIVDEERTIQSQRNAAVAAAAGQRGAEANVARSAAGVDQSKADLANAEAALNRARADYTYSVNNLHRVEPLLARQFVTVDQVDQIRTGTETKRLAVEEAQAQLSQARARLSSATAGYAQSVSTVSQADAQRRQSISAVRTLEPLTAQRGGRSSATERALYDLHNCTVHAPFDARVTDLTISEGAYAHVGQQIFTLIDTRVWWVVANYRETQLRHIRAGMPVDVYLLADPSRRYPGVVESTGYGVTPDASTVGTFGQGLPNVQRTLNWVHLASRYPVRIRMQAAAPEALRLGESAVVVIRGSQPLQPVPPPPPTANNPVPTR